MEKTTIQAEMIDNGSGDLRCTIYSAGRVSAQCALVGAIMRNIADNSGSKIEMIFSKAILAAGMQKAASVSIDVNRARNQGGEVPHDG